MANKRRQDFYQIALVGFSALICIGIASFVYREIFPEYKTYQKAYSRLEAFRSGYSHESPAPFSTGIKQILLVHETQNSESVDRCVSCHVAMDLPHFSPTRIAHNLNGQPLVDASGKPILEVNPDYVWTKLEEHIQELTHPEVNEELHDQGRDTEVKKRLAVAAQLAQLKTVKVDGREVAVEKVIQMHPLIGAETRPFEFHPLEKYGCVSCHSGNGRALVAKRAHGPVFDGEYETAETGLVPHFTEMDRENDPLFAKMYNHKPGHELIFQTTPLLAGPLTEAKCVQCHQPAEGSMRTALDRIEFVTRQKQRQVAALKSALGNHETADKALNLLRNRIDEKGREETIEWLNGRLEKPLLTSQERSELESQLAFLRVHEESAAALQKEEDRAALLLPILKEAFQEGQEALAQLHEAKEPVVWAIQDKDLIKKMQCDVDCQISNYQRGKELFVSQACYACHRIAGYSRNNVGPELSKAGLNYPWYIKESIVWPQADLPTSTMPNFKLDHEELAALMTFLMAQRGETKAISEIDHQILLAEWEKGAKMPWEEAVSPTEILSTRAGQLIFVSEGCASCHKLSGFTSSIELNERDRQWFTQLFPEKIPGSHLEKIVEEKAEEIDRHIQVTKGSSESLEEIESKFPGLLNTFYTHFKFAERAYNYAYKELPEKLAAYKSRLQRVLKVYIQEYGLGRDIAPNLSWSGVWREDEWLLGHFHNPTAYTPKSLMPVLPFDETKLYTLNAMLHTLGKQNKQKLREIWQTKGFDPVFAFQILCSSCHGEQRQGNGSVAQWIFPIPKNLRDPVFLSHLTKERAIDSITHGVKGTPMPPWGEAISGDTPVLSAAEVGQLVDWLFQDIPDEGLISKKWDYLPLDAVGEMKKEKVYFQPTPQEKDLVAAYFEERPSSQHPGQPSYYIREEFYTASNLENAEKFFVANCSICHGKEGAGTGARATSMVEAKPRVLTDLPWIRSQDDLQLLRAIKYGVPGTAMVPWGDQTTSAQRMGLVLFIRNLSRDSLVREELQEMLYTHFDHKLILIEAARLNAYTQLEDLQKKSADAEKALEQVDLTKNSRARVGELYVHVQTLEAEIKKAKERDLNYRKMTQLLKEEKSIYAALGESILLTRDADLKKECFSFICSRSLSYQLKDGKLVLEEQEGLSLDWIQKLEDKIKVGQQLAEAAELRHQQLELYQKL